MKTRVSLRYFVIYCLWKLSLDSDLSQAPSNLIFLIILVTERFFTLFERKMTEIKWQKRS